MISKSMISGAFFIQIKLTTPSQYDGTSRINSFVDMCSKSQRHVLRHYLH